MGSPLRVACTVSVNFYYYVLLLYTVLGFGYMITMSIPYWDLDMIDMIWVELDLGCYY